MTSSSAPLDAMLDDEIARGRVPGLAVAVVADGVVQHLGTAGRADVATSAPVTTSTSFLWFSMTKIVTATAALKLVDHGQLALDDDVERYVPGVLPAATRGQVRVRHLLQHSAGIPNPPPIRWVRTVDAAPPDPEQFLRQRFARVRKLRFEPGSRAAYTNLGYLLLGSVIAVAARRSFTNFVDDEVLMPLGMRTTGFTFPDRPSAVATGHQRLARGGGPLLRAALPRGIVGRRTGRWVAFQPFLVNGASYGGLVGDAADAARVLLVHANDGEIDGARIISERSAREMRAISLAGRPFDHGLGWFRKPADRDRRPAFVEHYGGGGGYHNLMRLYPDARVGIVVMGNSTSYDVDTLMDAIAAPWVG